LSVFKEIGPDGSAGAELYGTFLGQESPLSQNPLRKE